MAVAVNGERGLDISAIGLSTASPPPGEQSPGHREWLRFGHVSGPESYPVEPRRVVPSPARREVPREPVVALRENSAPQRHQTAALQVVDRELDPLVPRSRDRERHCVA